MDIKKEQQSSFRKNEKYSFWRWMSRAVVGWLGRKMIAFYLIMWMCYFLLREKLIQEGSFVEITKWTMLILVAGNSLEWIAKIFQNSPWLQKFIKIDAGKPEEVKQT